MAKENVSSRIAAKAGIWYTFSTVLFKAAVFLAIPVFTRVLTKAEYGSFNNIISWISLLLVFVSCDLDSSIIRAKIDFEDELDSYASSMLLTQTIFTSIVGIIVYLFREEVSLFTGIDSIYFPIIILYIFSLQGFYIYITKKRATYEYKSYSLITGLTTIGFCILSLGLILILSNKLTAIIYGKFIPYIIVGIILYLKVLKASKKIKKEYIIFGLTLSLPMVPHVLSLILLGTSDKIMINNFLGEEFTALYSVSAILASVLKIIIDSMNKAWAPWFLDTMKAKGYLIIRNASKSYLVVFLLINFGMLLFAPEAIYILGGDKYKNAILLIPPLLSGCAFQFSYLLFLQIEVYERKMHMIAVGTIVAAIVNIILNYFMIPIYGYTAAGYTTLIGYVILFIMHLITVRLLGYKNLFNMKLIYLSLLWAILSIPVFLFLYNYILLRYVIITVYAIGLIMYLYNKKEKVKNLIFNT